MNYNIKIDLPDDVLQIFDVIHDYGMPAYVVGGCVRDSIIGREIHDWDICTPALVTELENVFIERGYKVILTGIKHGTITVMVNGKGYEITTFRRDGEYSDGRRPDSVEFTCDLEEDLSRRDFTMNAIAYDPEEGFIDPFFGLEDINDKCIRCVGNPMDRFSEDALRILRAIRFACQLDFNIHPSIGWAIGYTDIKEKLSNVSQERIQAELLKMIKRPQFPYRLLANHSVFEMFIPEWKDMFFNQNNPYHIYNVAQHTAKVIENLDKDCDDIVVLAALFHDIGKPHCYQDAESGFRHFRGHGKVSAELTDSILKRLRFDNDTRKQVVELVMCHDATFEVGKKYIKRWLNKIGVKQFTRLLALRKGDILGQNPTLSKERLDKINRIEKLLDEILIEVPCFSLSNLKVTGNDVMTYMDIKPGKEVGYWLNELLNQVIDGTLENDREELIKWMTARKQSKMH